VNSVRNHLRKLWFSIRGVDPDPVIVTFASGPEPLARAMVEEVKCLLPQYRHMLVEQESPSGTALQILCRVRRQLEGRRVGMAPVLFHTGPAYDALRRAAWLLAPTKILAYNPRLERHHLQLRCPVASVLFLRGVPLDRIWLRPRWWPFRKERTVIPDTFRVVEGRPPSRARARVAVVSPYLPYPLSHGGAVRLFHLLRETAVDYDVFLFAFAESPQSDTGSLGEFCARITLVDKARYREPRWSTLLPPEVGEYRSPVLERLLDQARKELGITCVQIEYTQLAQYRGDILVEHDVTHDLYRQVHERTKSISSWWDWWRWRRFERKALRRFDRAVFMSEKDARMTAHRRGLVLANGVDLDRFEPTLEPDGRRLLFIGSFRHFPNIVAFRFLLEEIWPRIRRQFPDAELTVVAGPDSEQHWRASTGDRDLPRAEGVRLLGFVADVKPLYDDANIAVVPTLVSAGTNVKVIEAMAMRRAVVSTPSGCAGLDLVHGESVWIAESGPRFAEGVCSLLGDAKLRNGLAEAARRLAVQHFSWTCLGALQRELWAELVCDPLTFRAANPGDAGSIERIQQASPESAQWSVTGYFYHRITVAELQGTMVGFLVWRMTAPGESEILDLAVDPGLRRLGIASRLLTKVLNEALKQDQGELFLEVRESNAAARRLYEKYGFRVVGQRAGYYESPAETGIVMRLRKC